MYKKARSHRFYNWRLDRLASVGQYVYSNNVSFISWRDLLKRKGTKKLRRYMRTWFCIAPQLYGNLGHSEIIGFMSDGDGAFRPKFEVSMTGESWTPLFNSVPVQYRRLKDDGEPIKYFDLG